MRGLSFSVCLVPGSRKYVGLGRAKGQSWVSDFVTIKVWNILVKRGILDGRFRTMGTDSRRRT